MIEAIVYRFIDADGRLLYVGMTSVGAERWEAHARTQPWWHAVALVKVAHYPTRDDAALEEAHAIRDEGPLHNVVRYDRKPLNRGIYAEYRHGSVYKPAGRRQWVASIRWFGTRHVFADRSREVCEQWLARLLAENSVPSSEVVLP